MPTAEVDFPTFEHALRDLLSHLRDVKYQAPMALFDVLGLSENDGTGPLQTALLTEIESLASDVNAPPASRSRRVYESLNLRFVHGLTQEEAAERLHMSVRHLQRVQGESIHQLAQEIWRTYTASKLTPDEPVVSDWQTQANKELASLQSGELNPVADMLETLESVLELVAVLGARHGIEIVLASVPKGLSTAVPRPALRQMLITAIGWTVRYMARGRMSLHTTIEDGCVKITASGPALAELHSAKTLPAQDILLPSGTSSQAFIRDGHLYLWLWLPAAGQRTVVVVEDNPDMVHFYRRCTSGTIYHIVHLTSDQQLVDQIEAMAPDVVVLDVMLPEIDGWQLLTHLHGRSTTRGIPVIMCSVIREEELAHALGAAHFLSKPVQPKVFIEALDRVCYPAVEEARPGQAKSATA